MGTCKKGKECDYPHDDAKRTAFQKKKRSQSSPPAAPGTATGSNADMDAKIKTLQEEKKKLQQQVSQPRYCVDFVKAGCFNDNCPHLHAEQTEVNRRKKALAAAKKQAKRSQSVG